MDSIRNYCALAVACAEVNYCNALAKASAFVRTMNKAHCSASERKCLLVMLSQSGEARAVLITEITGWLEAECSMHNAAVKNACMVSPGLHMHGLTNGSWTCSFMKLPTSARNMQCCIAIYTRC